MNTSSFITIWFTVKTGIFVINIKIFKTILLPNIAYRNDTTEPFYYKNI